jgi:hypothetical protein
LNVYLSLTITLNFEDVFLVVKLYSLYRYILTYKQKR